MFSLKIHVNMLSAICMVWSSKHILEPYYIFQRLYCDADTGDQQSPLRQALESAGLLYIIST